MSSNLTECERLVLSYVRGRVGRREIAVSTAIQQRTMLMAFAKLYGKRRINLMGRRHIEHWMADRFPDLAPASRRNEFQALRQFVRWLIAEKHLKSDPMAGMKAPKVPRSVPRAMPAADVDKLLDTLPDARARLVVALMVRMGLRRGEVITVQVGDYDAEAETLTVTGKGGHTRLLPVPPDVSQAIRAYAEIRGWVAGPMVLREDGTGGISNSRVGQMVRAYMEAAGVKARPYDGRAPHALRHTAASNLVDAEPDLRVAQEFLGHMSLMSTQIYLRRAELGKMRAALERSA